MSHIPIRFDSPPPTVPTRWPSASRTRTVGPPISGTSTSRDASPVVMEAPVSVRSLRAPAMSPTSETSIGVAPAGTSLPWANR